ncbi:ASPIC and UnbV [compost metagenome]
MREISIGNNFVSQNPNVQHFGLGIAARVDEIKVQWPNGAETVLRNVPAGQTLEIDQP